MKFKDLISVQSYTFFRVVQLGSQVAAANKLGVTQATISIRLKKLSKHLGVTLFTPGAKTSDPYLLTKEAEELYNLLYRMSKI